MRKIFLIFSILLFSVSCNNKSKLPGGAEEFTVNDRPLIDVNRSLEGVIVQTGSTTNPSYFVSTTDNQTYWLKNPDPNILKMKDNNIYLFEGNITGKNLNIKSTDEKTIFIEKAQRKDSVTFYKKLIPVNMNRYKINIKINNTDTSVFVNNNSNVNTNIIYQLSGKLYFKEGEFSIENLQLIGTNYLEIKNVKLTSLSYSTEPIYQTFTEEGFFVQLPCPYKTQISEEKGNIKNIITLNYLFADIIGDKLYGFPLKIRETFNPKLEEILSLNGISYISTTTSGTNYYQRITLKNYTILIKNVSSHKEFCSGICNGPFIALYEEDLMFKYKYSTTLNNYECDSSDYRDCLHLKSADLVDIYEE